MLKLLSDISNIWKYDAALSGFLNCFNSWQWVFLVFWCVSCNFLNWILDIVCERIVEIILRLDEDKCFALWILFSFYEPQYFFFLTMLHCIWDLSSLTRDGTHTLCTGKQSLNHWIAREVPEHRLSLMPIKMGKFKQWAVTTFPLKVLSFHYRGTPRRKGKKQLSTQRSIVGMGGKSCWGRQSSELVVCLN